MSCIGNRHFSINDGDVPKLAKRDDHVLFDD
jgi:hypothetical protein